jgi:hypothetical protein
MLLAWLNGPIEPEVLCQEGPTIVTREVSMGTCLSLATFYIGPPPLPTFGSSLCTATSRRKQPRVVGE